MLVPWRVKDHSDIMYVLMNLEAIMKHTSMSATMRMNMKLPSEFQMGK